MVWGFGGFRGVWGLGGLACRIYGFGIYAVLGLGFWD